MYSFYIIHVHFSTKCFLQEFCEFRAKCGLLWCYDWVSIPMVYTQVVTLATYVFFIFTVGVYVNLFVFQLITFQMVIAGFLVAGAGYLFGGTLAWLFRLKLPQIKAVSIETAFQARLLFF